MPSRDKIKKLDDKFKFKPKTTELNTLNIPQMYKHVNFGTKKLKS